MKGDAPPRTHGLRMRDFIRPLFAATGGTKMTGEESTHSWDLSALASSDANSAQTAPNEGHGSSPTMRQQRRPCGAQRAAWQPPGRRGRCSVRRPTALEHLRPEPQHWARHRTVGRHSKHPPALRATRFSRLGGWPPAPPQHMTGAPRQPSQPQPGAAGRSWVGISSPPRCCRSRPRG